MSLRGVWVLSASGKCKGKLLFGRVFPTVEKRVRLLEGSNYIAIPDGADFSDLILSLFCTRARVFSVDLDGCDLPDEKPVHQIRTAAGNLWPLLVIEQQGLLFCCLPMVQNGSHHKIPLHQIQGISSGFSLLMGMIDFLGQVPKQIDETFNKLADLALFVGEAAPFGFPRDTNPHSVRAVLQRKVAPAPKRAEQQAAWRPLVHKGRGQLHFTVKEQVRVAMYDRPDVPDVWDVYGTVTCKAEIEGSLPEVSFTIGPSDPLTSVPLDHVITHHCVQNLEPQEFLQGEESGMTSCRVRVTPPLETVTLCHYTANSIREPPIHGFYQMKGEETVEVLLQLKRSEHTKNAFEYCELQLPFHHRGPILSHESLPTHGSVLLSPDKTVLVWNIGQRFPSRSLELQLKSTIHFGHYTEPEPESGSAEEMLCVGQNCFAQLFFKIPGYTLSGVTIDTKSIHVSPSTKYKTLLDTDLLSGDYRIWNSHGEVPAAHAPPPALISEMQSFPNR